MKNIPIAIKVLINLVFFVIYSIISMNLINFIYDFSLHFLWKIVPKSNDIIHLKIAWVVLILVLIFTILFRKYFYVKINNKEKIIKNKKVNPKISKASIQIQENLIQKDNNEKLGENKMKIYLDKEIK